MIWHWAQVGHRIATFWNFCTKCTHPMQGPAVDVTICHDPSLHHQRHYTQDCQISIIRSPHATANNIHEVCLTCTKAITDAPMPATSRTITAPRVCLSEYISAHGES